MFLDFLFYVKEVLSKFFDSSKSVYAAFFGGVSFVSTDSFMSVMGRVTAFATAVGTILSVLERVYKFLKKNRNGTKL